MKAYKISLIAALALGALMACASIASAQDNTTPAPKQGKKGRGMMTPEQRVEQLSSLNLTDDQKTKVTALFQDTSKKMQEVPADQRREKMPAIRDEETAKVKEILKPDQFEKYQALQTQRRGGKKAPDAPAAPAAPPQ